MIEQLIATPEDMEALGARVASRLRAGDVLALNGELGAGKTTFTRGLGQALGVRGTVTSPTFVLARSHPRADGAPLVHMDAYRLGSGLELDDLDVDVDASIVVVEWAGDYVGLLADEWLQIDIDRRTAEADDDGVAPRKVTVRGHGARWADLEWLR
ncbi:tRNA (adenosine(37)-N6)-threonylcarbamoyltransferase complex ATPase subunit type 1 TsaE [Lysobacter korlensis]|uniref:tRNA threonylcarbamoyladenosine biosynthesis protein TsaE n=1 Tax=Lysobacter korlensis TaxID=553636 RepID=A0ABV6RUX0_9GAMM